MSDPRTLPPSLWAATAGAAPATPPLEGDHRFDIAIVGGGFTGLSAALHAARARARVCVLEAGEPGWGASGRNGGQVIAGFKLDPDQIIAKYGGPRGERLVELGDTAPALVFDLVERYGIVCGAARSGWIQAAHGPGARREVEARAAQWAARGAPVEVLDAAAVARLIGTGGYAGGLLDWRGGRLQPLSFARGLAAAAIAQGALVAGRSPVTAMTRADGLWHLATPAARVTADKVLIATNGYSGDLAHPLGRSLVAVASFLIATGPLGEGLASTILPEGHVMSDTRKLLTYARLDDDGRLVVGGRGGFSDPTSDRHFAHVEAALARLYPLASAEKIEFRWSGRVAITRDYMPHYHEPAPGVSALVGFNGRGLAMATALGRAAGLVLATGERGHMPLPALPVRPIPFSSLRRYYLPALTAWYRYRDYTSGAIQTDGTHLSGQIAPPDQ
jgi:sarcosine oxidase